MRKIAGGSFLGLRALTLTGSTLVGAGLVYLIWALLFVLKTQLSPNKKRGEDAVNSVCALRSLKQQQDAGLGGFAVPGSGACVCGAFWSV